MAKELKSAANVIIGTQNHTSVNNNPISYTNNVENKTERTQILLRKSTKRALKRIAKKETAGSLNELINRICEAYISSQEEN